jgi:biotin carboxylase
MVLPAHALPPEVLASIRSSTRALALELGVVGLMNVQFAIKGSAVFVLEVNPRASRTVPFVSKAIGVPLAKLGAKVMAGSTLAELGYQIVATGGTQEALLRAGIASERVNKVREGRPHIVDRLTNREIAVVINTTEGAQAIRDSYTLRRQTLVSGIPYFTTIAAAAAAVDALEARRVGPLAVRSIQEYHEDLRRRRPAP